MITESHKQDDFSQFQVYKLDHENVFQPTNIRNLFEHQILNFTFYDKDILIQNDWKRYDDPENPEGRYFQ